jgi:hypothetical protein
MELMIINSKITARALTPLRSAATLSSHWDFKRVSNRYR